MLLALFASGLVSSVVAKSIVTGIGLGAGLYCASRTQKTSSMPKKSQI